MSKKVLSLTDITTGLPVQAAQVTQSVNAFTGTEDYSITISGSLATTNNSPTTLGGDLILVDNISAISQSNFTASAGGGGNVLLKFNKNTKLVTSATGVTVTGDVNTTTLNVGSITASANVLIAGGLSATDITASGAFIFAGNLDVGNITASGDVNVSAISQSNFTASAGETGNVFLKHGEVTKLVTSATGVTVTGEVDATSIDASGTVASSTGVLTDIVSEKTTNAGVTVEGVLVKDNNIVATNITSTNVTTTNAVTAVGGVFTDTITETTGGAGVTIEGTSLKDNDVTTTDLTTTNNVIAGSSVLTDTITEKTAAAGVTVEGVLMKDNNVTVSSPGIFSGDGSGLTNIPSSAIQPITFNQIVSGLATASIAPTLGLRVQTNNAGSITFLPSTTSALIVSNNTNISPDASGNGQLKIQGNGYGGYIALDGSAMNIGNNSPSRDVRFQTNEITRLSITQTSITSSVPIEINQQIANNADALVIKGAGGGGSVKGVVHIGMTNFSGDTLPGARITAEENNVATFLTNLLFSTRGTNSNVLPIERMRISNNGNVGIGATTPVAKLDILDTVNQTSIRVTNNNYNNYLIQKTRTDNSQILGIQEFGSNGGLSLVTGGAQRLNVNNLGNVGIGTTTPDDLLHISSGTSGDARLIIEADTDNNDENDVPQIWFKADGDITEGLIGLNNNYLDIVGNVNLQGGVRFFTGITSNTGTTDPYTGATERMIIQSTGNIGIGTTVPSAKLDVSNGGGAAVSIIASGIRPVTITGGSVGSINIGGNTGGWATGYFFKGSGGTAKGGFGATGNADTLSYFYIGDNFNDTTMVIQPNAGNVGIGLTSPASKLHVYQNDAAVFGSAGITVENDGTGDAIVQYLLSSTTRWVTGIDNSDVDKFKIANSADLGTDTRLTIDTQGNVGIGENIPLAFDSTPTRLHVKASSVASGVVAEVARFEGGTDSNGGGGTIRVTNANDRGVFVEGGRTDTGGVVAYGKIGTTNFDGTKKQNIFLDDSGAVGIGINIDNSTIAATLDVNGSVQVRGNSIFSKTGAGTVMTLFDNTVGRNNRIVLGANASGAFIFSTFSSGGTQNLILNVAPTGAGGNVGIGTASPTSKLHVRSASSATTVKISAASSDANYAYLTMTDNTVNTAKLTLGTTYGYNVNRDTITLFNGQVGIGTTTPNAKLEVYSNTNRGEAEPHFKISGGTSVYSINMFLDQTAAHIGQNSTGRNLRLYSGAETSGVQLVPGGTSWGSFSDERLKENITDIGPVIEKIKDIRCVTYNRNDIEDAKETIGFIAQDFIGKFDQVLDESKVLDSDEETRYSIKYSETIPVLLKAIQEQQTLIESLTARITALED